MRGKDLGRRARCLQLNPRASQQAGLETIPSMVRDVSDETAIAMALIENIQREDLNPIEEAVALQRLQQEFCF